MRYVSTRGEAPELDFEEVLLTGLARDGGLYVPVEWPRFGEADIRAMRGLAYDELALKIIAPFVGDSIPERDLAGLISDAYRTFDHDAVAPLKQLDQNAWVMELFHGPTLAFKDYALQLVGRMFDYVLKRRGERVVIVGATSGDTGSAAIEACRDRDSIDIFILHPHNRTSQVQRRQMTTVDSPNVHNYAVEGTFDDCQDIVKALFNDLDFRDEMHLSAVNSINWARVMAQIVYYFHAAVSLGSPDRPVSFSVPTGNFGNILAAYAAKRMGLPVDQLIVGSNSNDILTRFFESGSMVTEGVVPTISPSMDIQVSSNFERYLFELLDRDGAKVADIMKRFRETGRMDVGPEKWSLACETFEGHRLSDDETKAAMNAVYHSTGELLDPHSAIGVVAGWARRRDPAVPLVIAATAHPAKFPAAVEEATGVLPALPDHMSDLFEREERFDVMPADTRLVMEAIRKSNAAGHA